MPDRPSHKRNSTIARANALTTEINFPTIYDKLSIVCFLTGVHHMFQGFSQTNTDQKSNFTGIYVIFCTLMKYRVILAGTDKLARGKLP